METNIHSLFQFGRLVLPLFGRTPGICSVPQNPNVSWGHVFVSTPQPCCFQHVSSPIYSQTKLPLIQSLLSQYAPLSLRPLTCEVKAGHRWGPREQGCIQFQHASKKRRFFWSGVRTWWTPSDTPTPLVIVPFITTGRLSDATMSRWHLRYAPDVIGMHQVGPGDGRPSSCSADSLRGPILLAGFVLSPSPGPNRKTAKGRDPALYISFSQVTSSPRWCFCISKLPLFSVHQ